MINQAYYYRFALILCLWLAFGLRLYKLEAQSLRGDEAATVHYSALPIDQLWELSRVTDPHPPLYYLALHPWQWLLGKSAWTMRFSGVIASMLSVAALYALAQRTLHNSTLSLAAAALLAVNPLQIWLAQDLRSYPFFTLLGLLSSIALWNALTYSPTPYYALRNTHHALRATPHPSPFTFYVLRFIPYIFLTLACFYLHYYTVFLIAFQGLFVLLNYKTFWPQRWAWLGAQLVIGLLMIPGVLLAYNFVGQAAGGIEKLPLPDILRLAFTALLAGFTLDDRAGLWVSLLLTPVWVAGLVILLRHNFTKGSFWLLFFAVPVLGVIGLSIDRPFFKERFLIQAQPAFELLLAVGFLSLWQVEWRGEKDSILARKEGSRLGYQVASLGVVLLLGLLLYSNGLALSNYFTGPAYAKAPPWRLYHDYVQQKAQPGDIMLTNFPEASISYYTPDGVPFRVIPIERELSVAARLSATAQIAQEYRRIWFLPMLRQGFDEEGEVLKWLDRHTDRVEQVFFPDYNLNLYLSPATIEEVLINYPIRFAEGLQLRGYQILDRKGKSRLHPSDSSEPEFLLTLEPGEAFTLSFYWQADGPTAVPYTVFVHLIAADGFNRTSQDNQPVWGSYPTTAWQPQEQITDKYTLTLPAGSPPGDHRLRVGWYQAGSQERLPVLDEAGQSAADHIILNTIIRVE
jgi:hypothetical protein